MQAKISDSERRNLGGYTFCPHCATRLIVVDEGDTRRLGCPSCGFIHYNNPVPAAGAIVQKDGCILFVRRKFEPKAGLWSLPAGFMEYGESPAECTLRELAEETGLSGEITDFVGVYPAGDDPRSRVVLIVYHVQIIGGEERPGDDASELGYFAPSEFPPLAWASHQQTLRDFLDGKQVGLAGAKEA